ncbi:MAG: MFS transporter [Deltaproteobacteria bacterium]|nr:MFS transporter [Deltaproteobacteria bacterium]
MPELDLAAAPATPSILRQIVQPLLDLRRAPQVLWGVNYSFLLDGLAYFGMLSLLAMFYNKQIGLTDEQASPMIGALTGGITISMFFLGGLSDRWGVRRSVLVALLLLVVGRAVVALAPTLGLAKGLWGPAHLLVLGGSLIMVVGNGFYQPSVYAAVRRFSPAEQAPMGYAMLYALANLGGWLPTFVSPPVRKSAGIGGVFWVYVGVSLVSLLGTIALLTRRAEKRALDAARPPALEGAATGAPVATSPTPARAAATSPFARALEWLKQHPLADARFSFFIFALIPVQTLFALSWLALPQYVERAYRGTWVGDNFEAATNLNPILIFVLVPIFTSLTQRVSVYRLMVVGTLIMALPTFLLCAGPTQWGLWSFIVIKTIGEALWQPRFYQLAAEIAPPDRVGAYMGVAQFPWFLTKVITSFYAGILLARYCPEQGPMRTETMWAIHGAIACSSTVLLLVARRWLAATVNRTGA